MFVGMRSDAEHFGADIEDHDEAMLIKWNDPIGLAKFMYCVVFLHELGHHHDYQYRRKRKLPRGTRCKEASADLHAAPWYAT
jgi:hypothetical protein